MPTISSSATRTVGPVAGAVNMPTGGAQRLYISDYTATSNALVAGDEVLGIISDNLSLQPTGQAIEEVTQSGVTLAAAGQTTYGELTIEIAAPSSDAKVNMLMTRTDPTLPSIDRVVNFNLSNGDGSLDKGHMLVLDGQYIGGQGNMGRWQIRLKPFGNIERILVPTA